MCRKIIIFYDLNTAFAYYSTFSATSDNPRYRLCTYINRTVTPNEYKIITQAIMLELGAKDFDPVSSVANQIMFLPVRPLKWEKESNDYDCFYEYDFSDGEALDADKFLKYISENKEYYQKYKPYYRDKKGDIKGPITPYINYTKEFISETDNLSLNKVDPRTKNSIVGTFTTLYSIEDVMENFLNTIYERIGNRYKPRKSKSSAGGRIIDGGLFYLTPHSATDNAYGSLKNSYDLVMCNLEEILNEKEMSELYIKALKRGIKEPELKNIMYEWALSIQNVADMERERINKNKYKGRFQK